MSGRRSCEGHVTHVTWVKKNFIPNGCQEILGNVIDHAYLSFGPSSLTWLTVESACFEFLMRPLFYWMKTYVILTAQFDYKDRSHSTFPLSTLFEIIPSGRRWSESFRSDPKVYGFSVHCSYWTVCYIDSWSK